MTRMSGVAPLAASVLIAAASSALAQAATSPPPGTTSAGTAQSSGPAPNHDPGTTTGSAGVGSGRARLDPTTSPDAAIRAENELLNRKLKGICRGC
jgi:hypothetical protein